MNFRWLPRAQSFVFLALLLFLIGYLFSVILSVFAGMIILTFLIYAKQSFQNTLGDLQIKRTILEPLRYVNHPFHMKTEVHYSGGPVYLKLTDDLPDTAVITRGSNVISTMISFSQPIEFSYQLLFQSRGKHTFSTVHYEINDRWNLFCLKDQKSVKTVVSVHSDPQEIHKAKRAKMTEDPSLLLPTLMGNDLSREFEGIRAYVPGDLSRDIDWKVSSRLQTLITKMFQKQQAAETIIALDVSRSMRRSIGSIAKIEHGIAVTIQLTHILQSLHHKVGFIAFDEHKIISSVDGSFQHQQIFKACSELPTIVSTDQYTPVLPANQKMTDTHNHTKEQQNFLSTLSPFLLDGRTAVRYGQQATGIYQTIMQLIYSGKQKHIILISDLDTNHDAFYDAVSLACTHQYSIWILMMDTPQYLRKQMDLDLETVENIYQYELSRKMLIRKMRKRHVDIVELSPKIQSPQIVKTIQNMRKG